MNSAAALFSWPSVMMSLLAEDTVGFLNLSYQRVRGKPLKNTGTPQVDFRPSIVSIDVPRTSRFNGKILFVLTNSFPYSSAGYAQRSHRMLKSLQATGASVSALTRLGYPLSIGRFPRQGVDEIDGVRYTRAVPAYFPLSRVRQAEIMARLIVEKARDDDVSVLHTTSPWWNAVAVSWAAEELSLPWVYEVRGMPEATWAATQTNYSAALGSEFYLRSREKETEAIESANLVVTLSDTSKREILQRRVSNHRFLVAPNSIDASQIGMGLNPGEAKKRLGLPDVPIIGSVSSIVEYEGFETLILALENLPEDIHVLLVGDGVARKGLEELARRRGLESRVIFAGNQPYKEIGLWYSAIDVFALPRKNSLVTQQVTPIKALQAAAQGIPIVASDLPALREVTAGDAVFVPPSDPRALATGVTEALQKQRRVPSWLYTRTWDAVATDYLLACEEVFSV